MTNTDDVRDPYLADLIVGRLAWASHAGQGDITLDQLAVRIARYAPKYDDLRGSVQVTLDDLVELGLVRAGEPTYGQVTYRIAPASPDAEPAQPWREVARRAAEDLVGRCDPEPPGAAQSVVVLRDDVALLYDAVRTLDLLDRADHR